jgi:hypothetical protein
MADLSAATKISVLRDLVWRFGLRLRERANERSDRG